LTTLQAIILGLTQGVTEFAPISSSGHLILVPWLFNWDIVNDVALNKTFDVALHVGTLVGAVAYFRRDLWRYLVAWIHSIRSRSISTTDQRLAWALVIGTIPGAVLGAAFEGPIQEHLGAPWLIAVMLAVFGVVLWWVDARSPSDRGMDSIGLRTGLGLGLAQGLALQPGVSRSGITMTAARWIGIDRESAARFSFLLSVPAVVLSGLFELRKVGDPGGAGAVPTIIATVLAFVVGYASIAFLLRWLTSHSLTIFVVYRVALGVLVIALTASGAIS
jgi:undecaprenyl-diphosphatase